MKSKLWVPALLAIATFSTGAFAHGGDHDRWRHDQWRGHRHHHHAHLPPPPPAHWRHQHAQSHVYRDGVYYERPVAYREVPLLLPPPPHEVHRAIRNSLFGH